MGGVGHFDVGVQVFLRRLLLLPGRRVVDIGQICRFYPRCADASVPPRAWRAADVRASGERAAGSGGAVSGNCREAKFKLVASPNGFMVAGQCWWTILSL